MKNLQDFFVLGMTGLELILSNVPTAQAEIVERVEAIVNKKAIYLSDVTKFHNQVSLRAKVDPIFAGQAIAREQNPSEVEVVNFLVDEAIIVEKFPVNDAEVEQEINSIQANLKIDRDQLRSAISREGFKFDEYFKLMRASLSKRQLIDREIRNKATVSDDDIKSEYTRKKSGSKSFLGSFHLYLQKFSKKDYKSSSLARTDAEKALAEVKAGGTFGGEDLGYLAYTDMSPELQRIVQKLGPEKLSSVIADQDGFIIVKTGDVKSDAESAPDRDREMLRSRLMENEFSHQIVLWLDRERSNAFVKVNVK